MIGLPLRPGWGALILDIDERSIRADDEDMPMSDHPDNIVLALLREIRSEQAEMRGDLLEIKERLGILEQGYSSMSVRIDRMAGDVRRLNIRAGLIEA